MRRGLLAATRHDRAVPCNARKWPGAAAKHRGYSAQRGRARTRGGGAGAEGLDVRAAPDQREGVPQQRHICVCVQYAQPEAQRTPDSGPLGRSSPGGRSGGVWHLRFVHAGGGHSASTCTGGAGHAGCSLLSPTPFARCGGAAASYPPESGPAHHCEPKQPACTHPPRSLCVRMQGRGCAPATSLRNPGSGGLRF